MGRLQSCFNAASCVGEPSTRFPCSATNYRRNTSSDYGVTQFDALLLMKARKDHVMRSANAKLKRYNLTLPESTVERIATIREETEASSDSEVVRRAIRIYERLLKDSVEIVIQDKAGNKHTVLPETF
jgi:hypothetical protein